MDTLCGRNAELLNIKIGGKGNHQFRKQIYEELTFESVVK
jgi:hypothetical protein